MMYRSNSQENKLRQTYLKITKNTEGVSFSVFVGRLGMGDFCLAASATGIASAASAVADFL